MQILAIYPESQMIIVHRINTENGYSYDKNNLEKTLQLVLVQK
ncbi:MAG: hypothetical protein WAO74_00485 [Polaribacter sp.]|nr:hypothetical protein [Polaribacter sp.]